MQTIYLASGEKSYQGVRRKGGPGANVRHRPLMLREMESLSESMIVHTNRRAPFIRVSAITNAVYWGCHAALDI